MSRFSYFRCQIYLKTVCNLKIVIQLVDIPPDVSSTLNLFRKFMLMNIRKVLICFAPGEFITMTERKKRQQLAIRQMAERQAVHNGLMLDQFESDVKSANATEVSVSEFLDELDGECGAPG